MAIGSLYVSRPVLNGAEIFAWAKAAGVPTVMLPDYLHTTIIYSKPEFELSGLAPDTEILTIRGGARAIEKLGKPEEPVIALTFESKALSRRWQELRDAGAHSDWPSLKPHVSLSWFSGDIDISSMRPYGGDIVLGPEIFSDIVSDFDAKEEVVEKVGFLKVESLEKVENGLVLGFGIVCKIDGQDYYDTQGDHIPEDVMLKGVSEFMLSGRIAKEMHSGGPIGTIVHSFPLTSDVAKALGIQTRKTGWLVAMKPDSEAVLAKFASGEYTGFSIGGSGGFEADA